MQLISFFFLNTLVKVGKGDPVAYNWSRSYIDKSIRNVSKEVSESIKHYWVPSSKCFVHCDDKTTKTLEGGDHEKWMAV